MVDVKRVIDFVNPEPRHGIIDKGKIPRVVVTEGKLRLVRFRQVTHADRIHKRDEQVCGRPSVTRQP